MPESISTLTDTLTPPIFKGIQLNNDILGYIFSLNADMDLSTEDQDPAVVTLRYTSQVCTHWRDLVIGSSFLWARVLNLNLLCEDRYIWRTEIIRRAGMSCLHVKLTEYEGKYYGFARAVEYVLEEHWTRIRSLKLQFSWHFRTDEDNWRRLFKRPAPSLESFEFAWPSTKPSEYLRAPGFILFSNQAPSLRTLFATDMTLDLNTFPGPNLRTLILRSSFSTVDLLKGLGHIPFLETLEAKTTWPFTPDRNANTSHGSLPQVSLPHLTSIDFHVDGCVDIALSFLENIVPASGCTLRFYGDFIDEHSQEYADHDNKDLCGRVLSTYSQYCKELANATNLEMVFMHYSFCCQVDLPNHCQFSFSILNGPELGDFPGGTISTLLSSFTVMRLDKIRKLTLNLQHKGPLELNTDLTTFVFALISVEELDADPLTLSMLQDIQTHARAATFPSLKIIRIDHKYDSNDGAEQLSRVANFVTARVELGIPGDMLTLEIGKAVEIDVESLRKFIPGVKVQITPPSEME